MLICNGDLSKKKYLLTASEASGEDDRQPKFVVTVEWPLLIGAVSLRSTEQVTK